MLEITREKNPEPRTMFQETGLLAHLYLYIIGIVALSLFLIYGFVYDHKTGITDHEHQSEWVSNFKKHGLTDEQIRDIQHDDNVWYYQGVSVCVGYGDEKEECPKHETVCSGGDTFGNVSQQTVSVVLAIQKGGKHPECPLIYPSTN